MRNGQQFVRRGEIYYADLTPVVGSEQGGVRPVLIVQNDIGNRYSSTTIVCILTSKLKKPFLPTHVYLGKRFGLTEDTIALVEQIRTIDKARLRERVGKIDDEEIMREIDKAIHISMGLNLGWCIAERVKKSPKMVLLKQRSRDNRFRY